MDTVTEEQLCQLISEMSPEQLDRYLEDGEIAPILLFHIASCLASSCRRVIVESEMRVTERISQREGRSLGSERWKRDLESREIVYVMRERGIIK